MMIKKTWKIQKMSLRQIDHLIRNVLIGAMGFSLLGTYGLIIGIILGISIGLKSYENR